MLALKEGFVAVRGAVRGRYSSTGHNSIVAVIPKGLATNPSFGMTTTKIFSYPGITLEVHTSGYREVPLMN